MTFRNLVTYDLPKSYVKYDSINRERFLILFTTFYIPLAEQTLIHFLPGIFVLIDNSIFCGAPYDRT
jgi:hypothetical protein